MPNRAAAIRIQEQRTRARSLRELFGNTAFAGPADRRMQFDAHDRREDVSMAPDDARSGRRHIATVHARISLAHSWRQPEIGDTCGAVDANDWSYQLPPGNDPSFGSRRTGEGIVRMLRHCEGALRRVPEPTFDCGTRRQQGPERTGRNGLTAFSSREAVRGDTQRAPARPGSPL